MESPQARQTPRPASIHWTASLFLLAQGQLVSELGNVVYQIALGFFVLAKTGSTGLMGALMALGLLPRVLFSPLAGVVVDRIDRKWLIVLSDAVAGVAVSAVGLAGLSGRLELWMLFAAAVVSGTAGAFLSPAIDAAVPDIVPDSRLVRANSVFAAIHTAAGIFGNVAGGFLFRVLGAPLLFLANGLSFLASAGTEAFARIPRVYRDGDRFPSLIDEFRAGAAFVWQNPGLKRLLGVALVVNFFGTMAHFLILPLFNGISRLGPQAYGIAMGCFAGGALAGLAMLSAFEIRSDRRFGLFIMVGIVDAACMIVFPWLPGLWMMAAVITLGGMASSMANTLLLVGFQLAAPPSVRGRVLGLRNSLILASAPIAIALAGILAEFFSIRGLITAASSAVLGGFIAALSLPSVRATITALPQHPDVGEERK